MESNINPFNITKAVDLSDKEIQDFWVDLVGEGGFSKIVKPNSTMPMIILGGKGSGKTHIMRYFSYPLQRMRNEDHLKTLKDEGYIGIYFRCGGLNSEKFENKNQDIVIWQNIYIYYMELWLSELLMETIIDFFTKNPNLLKKELSISKQIFSLFDIGLKINTFNFRKIFDTLVKLRKNVDYRVNNCGLGHELKGINILTSPGKLIFGIPKILSKQLECFRDINFLYLLDEFENLTELQQSYIQTLIREKELPTTFKIGARLYGLRTKITFSASEENKEGSEFEKFCIDEYLRNYKNYDNFIRKLCVKRLHKYGFDSDVTIFDDRLLKNFDTNFEIVDTQRYINSLIEKKGKLYFEKFKKNLIKANCIKIEEIVEKLSVDGNPLLERVNILLFYRDWKKHYKKKNLIDIANELNKETKMYFKKEKTRHSIVIEKFKSDLEDQLILECGGKLAYAGIKTFIKMSSGIPRNLLIILKHTFMEADFKGEKPFRGNLISVESQRIGLKKASEWFFDDAKIKGELGRKVQDGIRRLAQFLSEIRFSDLPPECSLCAFTLNISELSSDTYQILESAEQSSYLIKINQRKGKSSKSINPVYQLNGILAPIWNLPIVKRGEIKLSNNEMNAIFNPRSEDEFDIILKAKRNELSILHENILRLKNKSKYSEISLFE